MEGIAELIESLGLSEENIAEIAAAAQENPALALMKVQQLLSPEQMEKITEVMAYNPDMVNQAMTAFGLSSDKEEGDDAE